MPKYQSMDIKKSARILAGVCGLFFVFFSIPYLCGMQGELLANAQYILSKGQTSYSNVWGSLIITALLLVIVGIYRKTRIFPLHSQALYFFPSCVLLGLMTSLIPAKGWSVTIDVGLWELFLYITLYLIVVWLSLHFPDVKRNKKTFGRYLWINLLQLSLELCVIAGIANTDDGYHYGLRTQKYIKEGNDSLALTVGEKSLSADRRLSAARAFALSRAGQMGDRLFDFPQEYGSNGLLLPFDDTVNVYNYTTELYRHLGAIPGKNVKSVRYYLSQAVECATVNPAAYDYLLCMYLLDKDLDGFAKALKKYKQEDKDLPKAYKEALQIYNNDCAHPIVLYNDSITNSCLEEYNKLAGQCSDSTVRANYCRRQYGNTYWWYYYFK